MTKAEMCNEIATCMTAEGFRALRGHTERMFMEMMAVDACRRLEDGDDDPHKCSYSAYMEYRQAAREIEDTFFAMAAKIKEIRDDMQDK